MAKKKAKTVNKFTIPNPLNLAGVAYKVLIMPGGGSKEDIAFRRKNKISVNSAGCIDNSDRVLYLENGRPDIGYIMVHELVHAASDVCHPDPNSKEYNKFYGETWTRAFSRLLYAMMKEANMIKEEYC